MNNVTIEITDRAGHGTCDHALMERALRLICQRHDVSKARFGIAVVGDLEMQELHRRYLQLDTTTDVLSFLLEDTEAGMEGEIAVNAQMADRTAAQWGWRPVDELLLYVIHGALHLVGFDDESESDREEMTVEQRDILALLDHPRPQLASSQPAPPAHP